MRPRVETVTLKRLSICPCGFPVLHDHIRVGVEYQIAADSKRGGFHYVCGGCGREQDNVEVVYVLQRTVPGFAPLPWALFADVN